MIAPTLCTVHNPRQRFKGSWIVEPKIDGMRVLVIIENGKGAVYSRKGNHQPRLQCFADELAAVYAEDCIVDGEIFARDLGSTIAAVRGTMSDADRLRRLRIHQFDHLTALEAQTRLTAPIEERKARLKASPHCPLIPWQVYPEGKTTGHLQPALMLGYEGIVLKRAGSVYLFQKSRHWQKYKPQRKNRRPCIAAVK